MRVLLTGATGFIGRHLVHELAQRHEVVALARSVPADATPAARWIEQDLTEELDAAALPDHVDAVVHLAQSMFYKHFPEHAEDIFAVNVHGTFRLMTWALGVGASRFVFASTGGVYGHGERGLEESDPVSPLDFYLRSKYASELLLDSYVELLAPVILRPFFVYGPGQEGMLVPTLARRILDGRQISIQGDPGLRINPIHVTDAVQAFARALEHRSPGIFNVAGKDVVTITDLVGRLSELLGRPADVVHAGDQPPGDLVGDITRMREELEVEPQVGLADGLQSVIDGL